ncbi:MAG TPA: ATP-binding protein [Streptosporangiaceae bacterium]|nr:ATP-binding protein [Streptosporangiaceae bacterium]
MRIEAELRPNRPGNSELRPELADIGRLTRRFMTRTIGAARAEEASASRLIAGHLGTLEPPPVVAKATWQAYDQVNVQTAVDAWLAEPGRTHTLTGLIDYRHRDISLPDLMRPGRYGAGIGSVETEALASGPGGKTMPCVQIGLYLTSDDDGAAVILLRGPEEHGSDQVHLEVACPSPDRAPQIVAEIKRLGQEHNVFRGHVIEFGGEVFEYHRGSLLSFVDRPEVTRDEVILPDGVIDGIERQVLGVARHAARLRASGQHLRRGVLLYGVPGTGKTHTLRYLLSRLPGVTAVLLSGRALGMIGSACSVARALQPCLIVVEDVDLIAEERDHYGGESSLLFELLNEMDGLGQDMDVTFLLTTNRADLLEEALAARPGRVDHAVELPVPDAEARARLVRLYQGNLELDLADLPAVIARTEGVTASFIKELLRRAALAAAEADDTASNNGAPDDAPIRVTDEHMSAALDQLLDTRSALTQLLLGGRVRPPA